MKVAFTILCFQRPADGMWDEFLKFSSEVVSEADSRASLAGYVVEPSSTCVIHNVLVDIPAAEDVPDATVIDRVMCRLTMAITQGAGKWGHGDIDFWNNRELMFEDKTH